jgi:hypothetical protein
MTITLDLRRSGAELIVRRSLVYPGRDCLQYSRHLVISCIRSSCVQARDRPSGPAGPGISNSLVAWMFHLLSRMTCGASVIGAFALALTGLFGVIAYSVAQRHREMAIRLALGALPAQVRGRILREGAALIAAGLAIGSIGTLVAARMLASVLFGVSPLDPPTIGGVAIFVVLTALTACYLATRTARIDTVSLLC